MIKVIATDIDGVWTDGSMYYDNQGNELKRFHTYDGVGSARALAHGIQVVILTAENTEIVNARARKLGIKHVYQGVKNKLQLMEDICVELGVELSETAYIGDDLNDLPLLQKVGFSGAPSNAIEVVKPQVNYICRTAGGQGAFREFVEIILQGSL